MLGNVLHACVLSFFLAICVEAKKKSITKQGKSDSGKCRVAQSAAMLQRKQLHKQELSKQSGDIETWGSLNHSASSARILLISSIGNFYHDYAEQRILFEEALRVASDENFTIEFVGQNEDETLQFLKVKNFSNDYDILVYNFCLAETADLETIDNVISQTRDLGKPALLLHCAMHSFMPTSPFYHTWFLGLSLPQNYFRHRSLMRQWQSSGRDARDFPYWGQFIGIDSLRHDLKQALTIRKPDEYAIQHQRTSSSMAQGTSPTLTLQTSESFFALPNTPNLWNVTDDERYLALKVQPDVKPLYVSNSCWHCFSDADEIVAWTRQIGKGYIVATTLGHAASTWQNEAFQNFLVASLRWLKMTKPRSNNTSAK